jgi:hypothetical protein
LAISPLRFPRLQDIRFPLRQIGFHGEVGFREIQCVTVIHCLSFLFKVDPEQCLLPHPKEQGFSAAERVIFYEMFLFIEQKLKILYF